MGQFTQLTVINVLHPRIGSDEDTEGSDESLSIEDPSDTAVSRSTMMEHRQDTSQLTPTTTTTASTSNSVATSQQSGTPTPTPSPQQQKEATTEREEEKEADTSEADGTLESQGKTVLRMD